MLLAVVLDDLCIHTPREVIHVANPVLALAVEPSALGKKYQVLLKFQNIALRRGTYSMNRSASAAYYPFQVMPRFLLGRQGEVYYIGGSDILPPPLETQREARILEKLGTPEEKEAKSTLIEHNLRLVVYIAKKFDNTGVSVEDLISIGTIGLIKAINTFNPVKNIKLATYASRCIENEILMYLRRNSKTKMEVP